MNKVTALTSAAAVTVLVTGTVVGTAFAWHPEGKITKSVQNVTAGGNAAAADTAATALTVKPGDVLQYTIEVENTAADNAKHTNDLAFTTIADTLPAGVVMVDTPNVRVITANLGTIKPGKSVVKQYKVKVTETVNGKLVENKACFFGDSAVKDSPKTGCDVAIVKVSNPPVVTPPVTPVTPVVPETPGKGEETPVVEEETPEALPSVGAGILAPFAAAAAAVSGFAANSLRLKRANRRDS